MAATSKATTTRGKRPSRATQTTPKKLLDLIKLQRQKRAVGAKFYQQADELLQHVQQHKRQSPLRPIDMPQLFRFARTRQPALSLGQFHDLVRRLTEAGRIRLSPFTQAMYQLPEPECALIVGREIMYYVEGV